MGEFIGQFTRGGVVGVVSAKRITQSKSTIGMLPDPLPFREGLGPRLLNAKKID